MDGFMNVVALFSMFAGGFLLGSCAEGSYRKHHYIVSECPVPPESEVVCGYVHDDNPNHAGLYLRGTGCAEYDRGEG